MKTDRSERLKTRIARLTRLLMLPVVLMKVLEVVEGESQGVRSSPSARQIPSVLKPFNRKMQCDIHTF